MQKRTQQEFIDECQDVHGDKYDYSLAIYKGCGKKVKIICPIHGIFEQLPLVKNEYCKKNNIHLLRISDRNPKNPKIIKSILDDFILKIKSS
jgi:hypothetical protein